MGAKDTTLEAEEREGGGVGRGCCVTTHPTELAGKLATLPRLFLYQINIFKAETFPI
jgi:hypothetical protein